jgi:hypothetical protein
VRQCVAGVAALLIGAEGPASRLAVMSATRTGSRAPDQAAAIGHWSCERSFDNLSGMQATIEYLEGFDAEIDRERQLGLIDRRDENLRAAISVSAQSGHQNSRQD